VNVQLLQMTDTALEPDEVKQLALLVEKLIPLKEYVPAEVQVTVPTNWTFAAYSSELSAA